MARYTKNNLSLKWARDRGLYPWKVEVHNTFSGFKTDMYYIADYIGISAEETLAIQSCGSDWNEHIVKLMVDERANTKAWLENPSRQLVLVGWRKVLKKRGGKLKIWKPRIWWFVMDRGRLCYKEENPP